MNKKIYYNNKFLEFSDNKTQNSANQTIKICNVENDKTFQNIVNDFLNLTITNSFIILNYSFDAALKLLQKKFSYIEAAGGFIENEKMYLFIHRLGKWDLPKGKLEKNETIETAAIRECEEECAIKNLKIIKQLNSTFHIYNYKNGFAFKQTYWFYMTTNYSEKLKPQLEENIDEAKWFSQKEIEEIVKNNTYLTIKDVVLEATGPVNTQK